MKGIVLMFCAHCHEFEWFANLFSGPHGRRSIAMGKSFTALHMKYLWLRRACIWTFIKYHWLVIIRVLQFYTGTYNYRKWWKRQVISGSRKGWGTGYESYFSLQRYLSFIGAWGGGGGGEKQLDFLFQCHLSVAQCAKFSMGSRFTDVRRHSLWTQYNRV